MPKKPAKRSATKVITLRHVMAHMQGMERRLTSKIESVEAKTDGNAVVIKSLSTSIDLLSKRVDSVEANLISRINSLGEDLTATMRDTFEIKKHVGMAASDEF